MSFLTLWCLVSLAASDTKIQHHFTLPNPDKPLVVAQKNMSMSDDTYFIADKQAIRAFDFSGKPRTYFADGKQQLLLFEDPEQEKFAGFSFLRASNRVVMVMQSEAKRAWVFEADDPNSRWPLTCDICPSRNYFQQLIEDPRSGRLFLNLWSNKFREDQNMLVEVVMAITAEGFRLDPIEPSFHTPSVFEFFATQKSVTDSPQTLRWVAAGPGDELVMVAEASPLLNRFKRTFDGKRLAYDQARERVVRQSWATGNIAKPQDFSVDAKESKRWRYSFSRNVALLPWGADDFLMAYTSPNPSHPFYVKESGESDSKAEPWRLHLMVVDYLGETLKGDDGKPVPEIVVDGGRLLGLDAEGRAHILVATLPGSGEYKVVVKQIP